MADALMSREALEASRSQHVREGASQLSAISLAEWMNLNSELGLPADRYAEEQVAVHLRPGAGRDRRSLAHRRYKLAQFLEWLGQQAERGIVRSSVLIAWCGSCGTPGDGARGQCPDCGASFPVELDLAAPKAPTTKPGGGAGPREVSEARLKNPSEKWSPQALQLHRAVFQARRDAAVCNACGASLESASLVRWDAGVGNFFDEYPLGNEASALLLDATAVFTVKCDRCGVSNGI
jgi:hypothetical protein